MAPVNKIKRKSKPPVRLDEFVYEESAEKEQEPRRSSRTPKISERLKRYMNENGGLTTDDDEEKNKQAKKEQRPSETLIGSDYREPKVVLKALPKTFQNQKGTKKQPLGSKKESVITIKRLGNSAPLKKKGSGGNLAGKSLKPPTKKPLSSKPSSLKKIKVKVQMEPIPTSQAKGTPQDKKGKRKRSLGDEDGPEPQSKQAKVTPKAAAPKTKTKDKEEPRLNPNVMEQLFNFGEKVEEALVMNSEAIHRLEQDSKNTAHTHRLINRLQGIGNGEFGKIISWLDEEERQRKQHREKVLESIRISHKTNMALYSHMLTVLQSVTTSV